MSHSQNFLHFIFSKDYNLKLNEIIKAHEGHKIESAEVCEKLKDFVIDLYGSHYKFFSSVIKNNEKLQKTLKLPNILEITQQLYQI